METVTVPNKLKKTVRGVARDFGMTENDIMTNAVIFYLAAIKKNMDLKDDMRMWDDASAVDLVAFERSIA